MSQTSLSFVIDNQMCQKSPGGWGGEGGAKSGSKAFGDYFVVSRRHQVGAPTVPSAVIKCQFFIGHIMSLMLFCVNFVIAHLILFQDHFMSFLVISCHFMSCH
jgi:hypothetical protein